jgi:hypothetical protein
LTTKHSPIGALRKQSDRIAAMLKRFERGETDGDVGGKIAASRNRPTVTFMVAMDDKAIKIEMSWALIEQSTEHEISEWVLKQMRETQEN